MTDLRAALQPSRRTFLKGAVGTAVAASSLVTIGALSATSAAAATGATVSPVHGAGLFDVDPSQAGVSQSPSVVVTGDITRLPLTMGF